MEHSKQKYDMEELLEVIGKDYNQEEFGAELVN
jgi:hypothetical protein